VGTTTAIALIAGSWAWAKHPAERSSNCASLAFWHFGILGICAAAKLHLEVDSKLDAIQTRPACGCCRLWDCAGGGAGGLTAYNDVVQICFVKSLGNGQRRGDNQNSLAPV